MNDSFVDFDLIGQVDPDSYKVTRPSFYSELIWDARKVRAKSDGSTIDWVVLRNRLQHIEARNMRRVSEALGQLAKRVGFRIIPGLGERVIYRELLDRKSVVWGKSVSVWVELGVRRFIKKKTKNKDN